MPQQCNVGLGVGKVTEKPRGVIEDPSDSYICGLDITPRPDMRFKNKNVLLKC